MHDSGTGGSASLGNFPIFAQSGCPNDDINACNYTKTNRMTPRVNESIIARPGYFDITLQSGVRTEMTVTNHTALYRFTFPETPATANTTLNPHFLVELTDLPNSRSAANITVYPENGRITGGGRFSPSFGSGTYQSYFCLDFDGAKVKDAGVWSNTRASNQAQSLKIQPGDVRDTPSTTPGGGWVQFDKPAAGNQILARVGMSFVSEAQACSNAEKEVATVDFDGTVKSAGDAWRDKFSVITLKDGGVSDVLLKAFWSGVYRSMISPQDYTGENPFWEDGEPYYDSYYCIWDSFRSIHPLLTILDPHSQTLMIRSLLSIYKHEGWLPDCRMSLCKGQHSPTFPQTSRYANVVRLHPRRLQRRHSPRRRLPQEHHRGNRLGAGLRSARQRRRNRAPRLEHRRARRPRLLENPRLHPHGQPGP
jgi:putative alpha-1,2-mannosidase